MIQTESPINKFSEFAKERKHLIGDKVNLKDILDIPIVVTDFKTDKSKFKSEVYVHHRGYTLLRKSSSRNMKSKLKFIVKHYTILDPVYIVSCIMSYTGWLRHCSSFNYLCRHLYTENILQILDAASSSLQIQNPMRCNYVS